MPAASPPLPRITLVTTQPAGEFAIVRPAGAGSLMRRRPSLSSFPSDMRPVPEADEAEHSAPMSLANSASCEILQTGARHVGQLDL